MSERSLSAPEPTSAPQPARARILRAAHELFYREGIRATGIDRVIAESGVTKVTFYRHFPSKNDLIREFLAFRHQYWMSWFADAVQRHGGDERALVPALAEWFGGEHYRGCAFINSVGEMGTALPDVVEISRRHKQDMASVIAGLLPSASHRERHAQALVLAVDGAIVRAQMDQSPEDALRTLDWIVTSLSAAGTDAVPG